MDDSSRRSFSVRDEGCSDKIKCLISSYSSIKLINQSKSIIQRKTCIYIDGLYRYFVNSVCYVVILKTDLQNDLLCLLLDFNLVVVTATHVINTTVSVSFFLLSQFFKIEGG